MKKSEIKVGGYYEAKVSDKVVTVRVDRTTSKKATGYSNAGTTYHVTNLATGRKLVFDGGFRFRREVPASKPKGGQHAGPSAHDPEGEAEAKAVTDAMDRAEVINLSMTVPNLPNLPNLPNVQKKTGLMESVKSAKADADHSPHLIVEARAGTGKTTTLIHGIRKMLGLETTLVPSEQQKAVWDAMELSKGKIRSVAFVAFNKAIADELKTKVPPGCEAMTNHGMGFHAVKARFGDKVQVKEHRVGDIMCELLGRDAWELQKKKPVVFRATKALVSLCKMNLVVEPDTSLRTGKTHEEQLDELSRHYEVELEDDRGTSFRSEVFDLVPRVLERCKDVKADNAIDYDDMIWLPVVLNLPVRKYDVLLVDEAQDLNRCQQALVKSAGRRLVLCGDPKQAIYGFAGADAESMQRMYDELGNETGDNGRGVELLPLTVTRRCGKAIVEEAKKIVPDFAAFETNPAGRVRYGTFKPGPVNEAGESTYFPDMARDGDMVLCRVNAPLVSWCFKFLKTGRKANIQGRNVGQGLITALRREAKRVNLEFPDTVRIPEVVKGLEIWTTNELAKENAKKFPSEAKLIAVQDRFDCLMMFFEGLTTVGEVMRKIDSVFTDDKSVPGIKLSSIHKAKGLESRRVFLIEPEGATVPHAMVKSKWQVEQEWNLRYVAITRAIEELVYVS